MILKQKLNYSWDRKQKYNVMFVMIEILGCIIAKACVYHMPSVFTLMALVSSVNSEGYNNNNNNNNSNNHNNDN